jgi:hypothetical protein
MAALGRTLGPEDRIGMQTPKSKSVAFYDCAARHRLESLAEPSYADTDVRGRGKVLQADVRLRRFVLFPEGRGPVEASFTEAQEDAVISALSNHRTKWLVRGQGRFLPDGKLRQITDIVELRIERQEGTAHGGQTPLSQQLLALAEDVPEEALQGLPTDGSSKLDEYLYGGPCD